MINVNIYRQGKESGNYRNRIIASKSAPFLYVGKHDNVGTLHAHHRDKDLCFVFENNVFATTKVKHLFLQNSLTLNLTGKAYDLITNQYVRPESQLLHINPFTHQGKYDLLKYCLQQELITAITGVQGLWGDVTSGRDTVNIDFQLVTEEEYEKHRTTPYPRARGEFTVYGQKILAKHHNQSFLFSYTFYLAVDDPAAPKHVDFIYDKLLTEVFKKDRVDPNVGERFVQLITLNTLMNSHIAPPDLEKGMVENAIQKYGVVLIHYFSNWGIEFDSGVANFIYSRLNQIMQCDLDVEDEALSAEYLTALKEKLDNEYDESEWE